MPEHKDKEYRIKHIKKHKWSKNIKVNIQKNWALFNAISLIATLLIIPFYAEKIFVIEGNLSFPEIFILFAMTSSAVFLFTLFITSFMTIQRNKECKGLSIFYLLGSLLSLLFFMVVKVMSDEVAHEWMPGKYFNKVNFGYSMPR
ncbi:MAG: hypothetical protein KAT14_08370 [Candidatus Marinimicrobia bacterium]|nr:hypothetical protein [Candidatus Neomarinimicrobiota bacterium]